MSTLYFRVFGALDTLKGGHHTPGRELLNHNLNLGRFPLFWGNEPEDRASGRRSGSRHNPEE